MPKAIGGENTDEAPNYAACPFNQGVECWPTQRNCVSCSWNPVVAKARIVKYCRSRNIQIPEKYREKPQT